jgi:hypothetical protein
VSLINDLYCNIYKIKNININEIVDDISIETKISIILLNINKINQQHIDLLPETYKNIFIDNDHKNIYDIVKNDLSNKLSQLIKKYNKL